MQLVTDLLTTTVRAFSLNAVESSRVADVMANAINKSKLTIDKLRIAFNFVGAAAAQTGLSLEETSASLMVLANNGLRASTMGTGLRQVLARMLAPSRKLKEAFAMYGIELEKINPAVVGYQEALNGLLPHIWNHEKAAVDMGKAYQLFGLRGAQAVAVLGKSLVSGEFKKALDHTYEVGTAAAMAAKQAEGLGLKFKNMADKAKLVALAIGGAGGVKGALNDFVDALRDVFATMEWFVKTGLGSFLTQTVLVTGVVTGLVAAFRYLYHAMKTTIITHVVLQFQSMIAVFRGLAVTLKGASGAWAAFNVLVHATGGPILWLIGLVTGLSVGLSKLASHNKKAAEAAEELAVELKRDAKGLEAWIGILDAANKKEFRDYEAAVKRFVQDNEELAKKLMKTLNVADLSTVSFEKLSNAMNEMKIKEMKDSIDKSADATKRWNFEIDKNTGLHGRVTKIVHMVMFDLRGLIGVQEDAENATKKYNDSVIELAESLYTLGKMQGWDINTTIEYLKKIPNISKEAVEAIETILRKTTAEAAARAKIEVEHLTKTIQTLPSEFKEVFDKLDALEQLQFLRDYNRMQTKVNDNKKALERMKYDEQEVADATAKVWDGWLNEYIDKTIGKRERAEQKTIDKRLKEEEKAAKERKKIEEEHVEEKIKLLDDYEWKIEEHLTNVKEDYKETLDALEDSESKSCLLYTSPSPRD